jgi:protein involved in polysaccharide export with SLBB domain
MITNLSKFKLAGHWGRARVWLAMSVLLAGCHAGSSDPRFSDLPGVTPAATSAVTTSGASSNSAALVAAALPPTSASANDADKLKVGDALSIVFSDLPYLQPPFDGPIKEDGTITLMQNLTFNAAGKTPGQLEREIRGRYVPDYFLNMTVTVTQKEMTRFYYVGGEVKAPGREPYIGPITLLRAIETAGDFTDFAKRTKVQLTRSGSTNKVIIINCIKARADPSLDIEIHPGDKIHVPRRMF